MGGPAGIAAGLRIGGITFAGSMTNPLPPLASSSRPSARLVGGGWGRAGIPAQRVGATEPGWVGWRGRPRTGRDDHRGCEGDPAWADEWRPTRGPGVDSGSRGLPHVPLPAARAPFAMARLARRGHPGDVRGLWGCGGGRRPRARPRRAGDAAPLRPRFLAVVG